MLIPCITGRQEGRHDGAPSGEKILYNRPPLLLCLPVVLCAALLVCTWGVVRIARMGNAARIVEPPPYLLPANSVPANIFCATPYDRRFLCRTEVDGEEIYLTTNPPSNRIVQTTITAHQQTIGNLVAAWGSPTILGDYGQGIYVYWRTRYAYLSGCRLDPGSPIKLITYGLNPKDIVATLQRQVPWHGFAVVRQGCLG